MAIDTLARASDIGALPADHQNVLHLLATNTYEQVREMTGWSRGRIHKLALRCGARKTEERIQRRAADRAALQREAFEEMLGKTVTSDVCDFMSSLPDESVQLFVTSPPYNIGKKYNGAASADAMRHVYYHGWMMQVISEMARALRPGGTIVFQVGITKDDLGATIPLDILFDNDFRRAGLTYQNRIVWPVHAGLTPVRRLAGRYETAMVFSKGESPHFNANAIRISQKNPAKRAFKGPNRGKLSGHPLGAHPIDVWGDVTHLGHNHPEKTDHPAQFPVAFAKRAILAYTMPDDVVADPFCGSGSSHVAAIELSRSFVGADLSYGTIRDRRLGEAKADTHTPFSGVTEQSMAVWEAEAKRVDSSPGRILSATEDARLALDLFGDPAA